MLMRLACDGVSRAQAVSLHCSRYLTSTLALLGQVLVINCVTTVGKSLDIEESPACSHDRIRVTFVLPILSCICPPWSTKYWT